jgi:hypothetical protein
LTQTFAGTLRLRDQEDTNNTNNTNDTNDTPKEEPSGSNYCSVVKKVKKENVTPENIGEIVLCQIPGISSVTAMAIMSNFTSFNHFMQELQSNPQCIDTLTVTSNGKVRKISKTSLENIRQYLLSTKSTAAIERETPTSTD